jgi:hypothetical protein
MTVTRRSYVGTAAPTKLASAIAAGDASFTVTTGTGSGYPTGVNPFVMTIDLGLATEEKCLCSARAADTFTVTTRGFDGTTAQSHTAGPGIVAHTLSALDMDQINLHGADTTVDDHTQYMRTDGTRHDLAARHLIGTTLPSPGFPTLSQPNDVAAAGVSTAAAAADHRHGRELLTTYTKDLRGHVFDTTLTNTLMVQAQVLYVPIMVYGATTMTAFTVQVTTGGSAGAVLRGGLYKGDGTAGRPSTRVIDGGTQPATTNGVNVSFIWGAQTLPAGLYWIAVVGQGAPATQSTLSFNNGIGNSPYVTDPTNAQTSGAGYSQAGVAGALPATATPAAAIGGVPLCFSVTS